MGKKGVLQKTGIALLLAIGIFIGLKSLVGAVWLSPDEPRNYVVVGDNGRSFRLVFLPDREAIIWYEDPAKGFSEGVLAEVRGEYGTHYVWRLWHVDLPNDFFGLRMYPPDTEPVVFEIKILKHFMSGSRDHPGFQDVGETMHTVVLLGRDRLRFQDMWLETKPLDLELVNALRDLLQGS